MPAAEILPAERLLLRRPHARDVAAIFNRYAADPEVTRFLAWPLHQSVADTVAFVEFSDEAWARWHVGPLLIESRADGRLLGCTGLEIETPQSASTGYLLARDSWGHGYAAEALRAIVMLAGRLGFTRLHSTCHVANDRSRRVLEKCGFECEGVATLHAGFPNLPAGAVQQALLYARGSAPPQSGGGGPENRL